MRSHMTRKYAKRFLIATVMVLAASLPMLPAAAVTTGPFDLLFGRWTGAGMLGLKSSPPERIKCRATYIQSTAPNDMRQTIRCATSGGSIEIVSNLKEEAGKLSGHWKETIHNFEGDLTGEVTPKGLHIVVQSADVTANMDIIVMGDRQVVEIQFINSSLIGLSLIMTKG